MDQISVVIASLGGASLKKTIRELNSGTIIPDEILICLPDNSENLSEIKDENVVFTICSCEGQVQQRSIGFKNVRNSVVLQLDDDVSLCKDSLEKMLFYLKIKGQGNVVGPIYYNFKTGRCISELSEGLKGFIRNIYEYFVCGAPWGYKRMGTVSPFGFNYGVDPKHSEERLYGSEWLPGGCVLSYKKDLILDNFFPYQGKAFCEDIINSFLRKKIGVAHWTAVDAKAYIIPSEYKLNSEGQFRARRYYTKLRNGSIIRLLFYEQICKIRWLLVLLKCYIKNKSL